MTAITYQFAFASGRSHTFEIEIDRAAAPAPSPEDPTNWTRLEHHQCANCPLHADSTPHCPVAVDLRAIAAEFGQITSIERVDVTVVTEERTYLKNCDAQQALMSLLGLVMATSKCPILAKLEPLAHFHLPFANLNEIAMRVAGTYLIKQRARYLEGDPNPDWKLAGIESYYRGLEAVNIGLLERLRSVSEADANGNALNTLYAITSLMHGGIDETLSEITPLAKALL